MHDEKAARVVPLDVGSGGRDLPRRSSPGDTLAAELPNVWSYEGERHGRHDVSICLGTTEDDSPHECYATVHGKTVESAHERATAIVEALREAALRAGDLPRLRKGET